VCGLAGSVVKSAWSLANGGDVTGLVNTNANCQLVRAVHLPIIISSSQVADLFYCLLRNQSCSLGTELVASVPNPGMPFSRYVGVAPASEFSFDPATGLPMRCDGVD
jgi:hypothetical protein